MTSLLPDRVRPPAAAPCPVPPVVPLVSRPVVPPVAPSTASRRSWTPTAAALAAGSLGAALVAVLVAALLVGGGAPAPATAGLPDAGAVVGWGQPVVQLLGRVLAVLVVGSLLVAALLVPAPGGLPTASRRAVRTAAAAAAGWAACEVAGLVLLTASLLARPVTDLALADVVAVVPAFPAGRTVLLVLVLLAVVVAGHAARTAWQAGVLLLVALAAVVLPVLTSGHPAAAGDHAATVTALAVHVVAASLWVGGLLGVLLHLAGPAGPGAVLARVVALQRLSRLAMLCVVVVTGTGVVGALLVTDRGPAGLPDLLASGYGALLVAKTAAVVLLVAAGWAHRRRTLPAIAAGAPRAFLRLAVVETGLMLATLAVAVGLASSPPPENAPAAAPAAAASPAAEAPAAGSPAAAAEAPVAAGAPAPGAPAAGTAAETPAAEDMSGHDHGELSVAVLVDGDRLHVGDPVTAGTPVTVYNTGPGPVVLRADDGTFSATVPSRTFITFPAPQEPGAHAFGDPDQDRYRDVLTVVPPAG